MSRSYVLRITTGERNPSAEFKGKAAEALGVPESLLFPAAPSAEDVR